MEVMEKNSATATHKGARIGAQKTRLVIDLIRGKDVATALSILKNNNTRASVLIEKVLKSSIANAVNNLKLDETKLYVKECFVNDGPVLKRIKMGSRGHVDRNDHRTSHIIVTVAERL